MASPFVSLVQADVRLMLSNALRFNRRASPIYRAAQCLRALLYRLSASLHAASQVAALCCLACTWYCCMSSLLTRVVRVMPVARTKRTCKLHQLTVLLVLVIEMVLPVPRQQHQQRLMVRYVYITS